MKVIMGFFTKIVNVYRKSQAATEINLLLLEFVNMGLLDKDPGVMSRALVMSVWNESPDLYEGRLGKRPEKTVIAAAALATAIEQMEQGDLIRSLFALALGKILIGIDKGRNYLPYSEQELRMITAARQVYYVEAEKIINDESLQGLFQKAGLLNKHRKRES